MRLAQITGHCQALTAHWSFVYEHLGVSRDVWAAKPKLRLQSLSSRWPGALQTNFSRKSKVTSRVVSRAEAPPQISLSASQSAALGTQGASAQGPAKGQGLAGQCSDINLSTAHLKPSCHLPPSVPVSLISVCRINSTQARNLEIILDQNQSPVILAPMAHPTSLSLASHTFRWPAPFGPTLLWECRWHHSKGGTEQCCSLLETPQQFGLAPTP